MSGLSAVEQSQHQSSGGAAEDSEEFLRAAVLKSRRNKRRKAPDGTDIPSSLPPRPISTASSIQLDYGTEDPPRATSVALSSIPATSPVVAVVPPTAPPPPASKPEPMEVDNGEAREEGEISDSEDQPPPRSSVIPRQAPPTIPAKQDPKDRPMPPPIVTPPSILSVKTEPSPRVLPASSPAMVQAASGASRYSPTIDHEMYAVDEDHVRPGLASQYSISVYVFANPLSEWL